MRVPLVSPSAFLAVLLTAGCGPSGPAGSAVEGVVDHHCGSTVQPTSQAACQSNKGGGGGSGGVGDNGGSDYGPTRFNQESDDDDCKYHVSWTSTPIYENDDVTFTLKATRKDDGKPATDAVPFAEVFLGTTHPAPPTDQKATEGPPGTYAIAPIRFDEAGTWTVRFHLYETCLDIDPESPHGHAAFFVKVP